MKHAYHVICGKIRVVELLRQFYFSLWPTANLVPRCELISALYYQYHTLQKARNMAENIY